MIAVDSLEFSLDPVLTLGGDWDKQSVFCVCIRDGGRRSRVCVTCFQEDDTNTRVDVKKRFLDTSQESSIDGEGEEPCSFQEENSSERWSCLL